jgi:NIPSNAP
MAIWLGTIVGDASDGLWHGRPALCSAAAAWPPSAGRVSAPVAMRDLRGAAMGPRRDRLEPVRWCRFLPRCWRTANFRDRALLTARDASPNDPGRPRRRSARRTVEESVLIDHRYYRIKPGMVPAHLDIYEKHGFAAQSRHLGKPFAYLFTESGEVNTLVHMWLYDDAADRAKKRAAMAADPEWQNYLRLNNEAGYTVSQQNNLMLPTRFAPIQR